MRLQLLFLPVLVWGSHSALESIRRSVPMADAAAGHGPDGKVTVPYDGAWRSFQLKDRFVMSKELFLFTAALCGVEANPTASSSRRRSFSLGSLKSLISSPQPSATCSQEASPEYVIKYVDNCSAKKSCGVDCQASQTDPLVDEFVYSKFISDNTRGIIVTPQVVAISAPFVPAHFSLDESDPPENFEAKFLVDKIADCTSARARFIVEMRVGPSVTELMSRFFRPLDTTFSGKEKIILATKIFLAGISLLERIHANKIAHGDIHPGNIALLDFRKDALIHLKRWVSKEQSNQLVLIDFGKAREIGKEGTSPPESIDGMNFALLSPWHLRGEPIGARDDVFRMFEIYLNLISAEGLAIYYSRLEDPTPDRIATAKLDHDLIAESRIIPEADVVTDALNGILDSVRSGDKVPDYALIRELSKTILVQMTKSFED